MLIPTISPDRVVVLPPSTHPRLQSAHSNRHSRVEPTYYVVAKGAMTATRGQLIDGYSAGAVCSFGFVDGLSFSRIA